MPKHFTKRVVIAFVLLSIGWTASGFAQQVRILILEAHHGKPVSNECLNISLSHWHGTDLYAATNKDGIVELTFSNDHVSADTGVDKACAGMDSTKSIPIAHPQESLAILPNYYVSCQYSKEQTKNPVWLHNPMYQHWIPSFDLQDILAKGVVAKNTCSNLIPTAIPGELVLVVRKRTFWEGMKS